MVIPAIEIFDVPHSMPEELGLPKTCYRNLGYWNALKHSYPKNQGCDAKHMPYGL